MLAQSGIKMKKEALIKWLDSTGYDGKFAILDDDLEEGFQNEQSYGIVDHFVKTDTKTGLTEKECKKVIDLLN